MKKISIIIISIFLIFSCQNIDSKTNESRIILFEKFLGKNKANALTLKVVDFEKFLQTNLSEISIEKSYAKYLEIIKSGAYDEYSWNYNATEKKQINKLFESSGLKQEIWNYNPSLTNEEFPLKTFNKFGKYLKGLELIQESDSTIINYIKIKKAIGDVSKNILADGLLKNNVDFSDYFIKRIIVVEFYPAN